MVFNSFQFAVFYALVWAGVFVLAEVHRQGPRERALQTRNLLLLVASYIFYGFWNWKFLSLIILSTLVDYYVGRRLEQLEDREHSRAHRKRLLLLSLVTNLGLLGFFKYYGFFAGSAVEALAALGFAAHLPTLQIILPVGISFYTFQTLSYTIDVYRGRCPVEHNLVRFAAYVAFFPQLVAGPIERARDLLPQFSEPTPVTREGLETGTWLIAWGLFKKVVIADNLAHIADAAFALPEPTGIQALIGTWAFAWQIYCDFSGYTDVARGAARCLGFELRLNFDLPYFARSPSDFWRRWHISLSSWLRDYLYIPLGGNRKGTRRTYINLALTMLLGGLWHGAAWTFVAWGAFHGAILCIYRLLEPRVAALLGSPGGFTGRLLSALNMVFFFHVVCLSWVLFRAGSLEQAWHFSTVLLSGLGPDPVNAAKQLGAVGLGAALCGFLYLVQLIQYRTGDALFVLRLPVLVRGTLYALGALVFLFVGEFGGAPFIYFQF